MDGNDKLEEDFVGIMDLTETDTDPMPEVVDSHAEQTQPVNGPPPMIAPTPVAANPGSTVAATPIAVSPQPASELLQSLFLYPKPFETIIDLPFHVLTY